MSSRYPSHRPEHGAAPFRRAAKTLESWVLSDLGRLTMTPRSNTHAPPVFNEKPSRTTPKVPRITTSSPSPSWTTHSPASSFPQSTFPAPSYAPPPTPRGHADWTPDTIDLMSRTRQLSTASTASTSSMASTSSFVSTASSTEDPDELPGYDVFLRQQEEERIKPFPNEDREVFQALREVDGSDCEDEEGGAVRHRGWR